MGDMADYCTDCGYESDSDYSDRPRRPRRPDARTDLRPDEWVQGDGARIKIRDMADAHLFFAIAKGYRDEYRPGSTAAVRMPALEREAKRRLESKIPFGLTKVEGYQSP